MAQILIQHAYIHTAEQTDYPDGYILTRGDKIAALGAMEEIPSCDGDTLLIEGAGRQVYPGLIDAHCHVGLREDSIGAAGDDLNEDTDPLTPHLRAIDGINPLDRCFTDARRAGITTVVTGPGSANIIGGQFAAVKTAGRCIDDMIVKAPVAMKFALGENPKHTYGSRHSSPVTRMATAALLREFLEKSRRYHQQKQRHHEDSSCPLPDYDMRLEAMEPVMTGQLPVKIHAHRADDICTALRIGEEFSLDYTIEHATEGHLIPDILARHHAAVMLGPTLSDRSKPELSQLTYDTYRLLEQAGLSIAIITDYPEIPIEQLPLCAALAVKNGMSAQGALYGITRNAACNCRIEDRVGSLAVGKDADLILTRHDPLSLDYRPALVMVSGEVFSYE